MTARFPYADHDRAPALEWPNRSPDLPTSKRFRDLKLIFFFKEKPRENKHGFTRDSHFCHRKNAPLVTAAYARAKRVLGKTALVPDRQVFKLASPRAPAAGFVLSTNPYRGCEGEKETKKASSAVLFPSARSRRRRRLA